MKKIQRMEIIDRIKMTYYLINLAKSIGKCFPVSKFY